MTGRVGRSEIQESTLNRRSSAVIWLVLIGLVLVGGSRILDSGKTIAADPTAAAGETAQNPEGLALFTSQVRMTLAHRCLKCHGGETIRGDFDISTREGLIKGGHSGTVVTVMKHDESRLFRLISHLEAPAMPFEEKKLSDDEIAAIGKWIDLGAPYDRPFGKEDNAADWTVREIPPEARNHWSFQPLSNPAPPAVNNRSWCRNPIDEFLLAKMEGAGITPNPPADRRKLIRRAYLDLIGILPTPSEVEAFVSDPAADAYERLIDRLLDSPHYGERWGRHWLDLARFAESHGFEHDTDRPTAYPYRDFVIQAYNSDMPYDQFVRWQLAGDELAPEDNLALKATGFLAAGVHSTQITKNEVEKHRYDELDDMLATASTAFLGLTIGCARCHDHKFDPIPQRDYYQLLSTFTTAVRSEVDLTLDKERYQKLHGTWEQAQQLYQASLTQYEQEYLPGARQDFAATKDKPAAPADWLILDPVVATAKTGKQFVRAADGSLLCIGPTGESEEYLLEFKTVLQGITTLRIEALADDSLMKRGPGRAPNGNFSLTHVALKGGPADGSMPLADIALSNPRATFEQNGLPAAAAIDQDPKSGWGVDPRFGEDHAIVLDLAQDLTFSPGTQLSLLLQFNGGPAHSIGRIRVSVTARPRGVLPTGKSIAAPIVEAQIAASTAANADQSPRGISLDRWLLRQDATWRELQRQLADHSLLEPAPKLQKAMICSEGLPPVVLNSQGGEFLPETHFLRRGDPNQKVAVAEQGFLQALVKDPLSASKWRREPPAGSRTSFRRASLANWICDVESGGGGLLARVMVNRLWQHHFGQGIVTTPSDFGSRGEAPTHPELLDWLARELIRQGWRLKPLHKAMMMSAAYQESADATPAGVTADRDNRLYGRFARRRMEGEIVRDAILSASGMLDPTMFGPGTLDEASRRRSIYFTIKRSQIIPLLQVFDFPDTLQGMAARPTTTVAPQALLLMNNKIVREFATNLARTVYLPGQDPKLAIEAAYQVVLCRSASPQEIEDDGAFITAQIASYQQDQVAEPTLMALADFCQMLFCTNEFVYID